VRPQGAAGSRHIRNGCPCRQHAGNSGDRHGVRYVDAADTRAGCTCPLVGRVIAYQGGTGSRQIVRRYTVCKFRQSWRYLVGTGPTRDCCSRSAPGSARTATPKTGTNARRGGVARHIQRCLCRNPHRRPSLRYPLSRAYRSVSHLKRRSTSSGVGDFRAHRKLCSTRQYRITQWWQAYKPSSNEVVQVPGCLELSPGRPP